MTIDMEGPGTSGFGYGGQGGSDLRQDISTTGAPPAPMAPERQTGGPEAQPGNGPAQSQAGNGGVASGAGQADGQPELGEVVPMDLDYSSRVPGFETSASDCFNHALSIARSLNHAILSTDHLMLALTMDEGARRLLSQAGDIARLREASMRRLGKMHSRFAAGDPAQTSDLVDIRSAARASAAAREQLVAICDLVNAFPKENDRLIYGAPKNTRTVALVETIEKSLVPRVSDAVVRIEAALHEATQGQRQTVQNFLDDLNARQFRDEQRQREFMDEVRRQVREAVDTHLGAALRELDGKFEAKLAEADPPEPDPEPVAPREPVVNTPPFRPTVSPPRRSYWCWIIL